MISELKIPADIILALLAIFMFIGIMMLLFFMMQSLKDRSRSRYDFEEHQARLSDMRESFEKRLAELNYQLMSSEHRWKEVNHLVLSAQTGQIEESPERVRKHGVWSPDSGNTFLSQMGIDPNAVALERNLVFVLTPFEDNFQEDYLAIKEACSGVGLRCVRGDEEQASGDILKHILTLIARADFVIANISSRNPNVFYELGIAQAMGKDSILVARDKAGLAFDLQSQRVLLYKNSKELPSKLREMLLRTLVNRR